MNLFLKLLSVLLEYLKIYLATLNSFKGPETEINVSIAFFCLNGRDV